VPPAPGPSEIDPYFTHDANVSNATIDVVTRAWLQLVTRAQQRILDANKFTWSLMVGQNNANAMPLVLTTPSNCTDLMRESCHANSPYIDAPLLMGVQPGNATSIGMNVAAFLLARGPHACIGYGQWGLVWPNDASSAPLPPELFEWEYGLPRRAHCHSVGNNIWARRYDAGLVSVNCDTFQVTLPHM
jgi:hypothetical protein